MLWERVQNHWYTWELNIQMWLCRNSQPVAVLTICNIRLIWFYTKFIKFFYKIYYLGFVVTALQLEHLLYRRISSLCVAMENTPDIICGCMLCDPALRHSIGRMVCKIWMVLIPRLKVVRTFPQEPLIDKKKYLYTECLYVKMDILASAKINKISTLAPHM